MMLVSFHPIVIGDINRICAGRDPDETDRQVMEAASAIVLPQGCTEALYTMARETCESVFPNYTARFAFPGKTGQTRLFQQYGAAIPKTVVFPEGLSYADKEHPADLPLPLPFVLKDNWGGEGSGVHLIDTRERFDEQLARLAGTGSSDTGGFLVQEWVDHGQRTLRVVVIGQSTISYWRLQDNPSVFGNALRLGGQIDPNADPDLQRVGRAQVNDFCRSTGINLAGFDLIFPKGRVEPLFLEINYFFGRTGLGGSKHYYQLITSAVRRWVDTLQTSQ